MGVLLQDVHYDAVERLVVDDVGLVSVLEELVGGQDGVVGLDDGVGDLGRRVDRVGLGQAIRVGIADLEQEQSSKTGARASAEGVGNLEALDVVGALRLLTDDVDGLLGALGVVALGPVVARAAVAEHEVVGLEGLADRRSGDNIECTGLEVDHHGTRDPLAGALLALLLTGVVGASAVLLLEVDVDLVAVKVHVEPIVGAFGRLSLLSALLVQLVLSEDGLPEARSYLVTGLAYLETDNFTDHVWFTKVSFSSYNS